MLPCLSLTQITAVNSRRWGFQSLNVGKTELWYQYFVLARGITMTIRREKVRFLTLYNNLVTLQTGRPLYSLFPECKYAIGECVWLLREDSIHRGIWSTCCWSFKRQTQTVIKDEKLRNNLGYYSDPANSCGLSVKHASQLSSPEAKSYKHSEKSVFLNRLSGDLL